MRLDAVATTDMAYVDALPLNLERVQWRSRPQHRRCPRLRLAIRWHRTAQRAFFRRPCPDFK